MQKKAKVKNFYDEHFWKWREEKRNHRKCTELVLSMAFDETVHVFFSKPQLQEFKAELSALK